MDISNRILNRATEKAPEKKVELRQAFLQQPSIVAGTSHNFPRLKFITEACSGVPSRPCNFNFNDRKYRRINGQCNDHTSNNPFEGATDTVLRRLVPGKDFNSIKFNSLLVASAQSLLDREYNYNKIAHVTVRLTVIVIRSRHVI